MESVTRDRSDKMDEFCSLSNTGDILFFDSDERYISSKMIRSWLSSPITHIGMVFKPKTNLSIPGYGDLEKGECYFWEMGRNTDAKTCLGNGTNFTEARLVKTKEMLSLRETKVFWKKIEMNSAMFKEEGFAKFMYAKICDSISKYITKKVGSVYDPYISAFWLMRDGIWPFAPRIHHKIEDQFMSTENVEPKHCSQLVFQTCAHAKIFRTRKDSYTISPGDIYDLTKELCSPFVTYGEAIQINPSFT